MVGRLFLAVPRGCLQFVIVVFPDHTHLLFLTLNLRQIKEEHWNFISVFSVVIVSPDIGLPLTIPLTGHHSLIISHQTFKVTDKFIF